MIPKSKAAHSAKFFKAHTSQSWSDGADGGPQGPRLGVRRIGRRGQMFRPQRSNFGDVGRADYFGILLFVPRRRLKNGFEDGDPSKRHCPAAVACCAPRRTRTRTDYLRHLEAHHRHCYFGMYLPVYIFGCHARSSTQCSALPFRSALVGASRKGVWGRNNVLGTFIIMLAVA